MFLLWAPLGFASEVSDEAWEAYLRKNYALAQRLAERGLRDGATRDEQVELRYLTGMSLKGLRQYPEARAQLEQVAQEQPLHPLAPYAKLSSGETSIEEGQYEQAGALYQAWRRQYPGHSAESLVRFQMGLVALKQGNWEAAKVEFAEVARLAPESAAARAAQRLVEDGLCFTVQVGSFANQANATRLTSRLAKRGYQSYLQGYDDQGRAMYRVRVGRFDRRADAEEQARRLHAEGFPTRVYP